MSNSNITGIANIKLSVRDLDLSIKFLKDFGLSIIDNNTASVLNESQINLIESDRNCLESITWHVNDLDCLYPLLKSVANNVQDLRKEKNQLICIDCHGIELIFTDLKKKDLQHQGYKTNSQNNILRINTPVKNYITASPYEIAHIVLLTSDIDMSVNFYTGIGFTVSDRIIDRGVFLRSSFQGHHHQLFLIDANENNLHHIAFSVSDIYELFAGGKFMEKQGWKTYKGPGRHYISSSTFWYFNTPLDAFFEYSADADYLDENWIPKNYDKDDVKDEEFISYRYNQIQS